MDVVNASFVHPGNVVNNRYAPNQGYGYDTAGNLTAMPGGGTYAYDAENRQTNYNAGSATYHYDGNAKRVKKVAGSVTTVFVYDAGGLLVAEYANETPTSAGTSYFTDDHLGSNRLVTDASGAVKARHDYLPFGEELCSGTGGRTDDYRCAGDPVRQKFTGKERDAETGLDYFLARYYSGKQGRFTSPDEFTGGPDEFYEFGERAAENPTFYGELTNPQSLNKYQYTYNNPINMVDPDGHCVTPECLWDAANVGIGVVSLYKNVKAGNYGSAVVDGIGVVIDSAAVVVPIVPGGAGAIIKAVRGADKVVDAVKGANKVDEAAERTVDAVADTSRAARREATRQQGIPTSQQPARQVNPRNGAGRSYDYKVPKPGGGTRTKTVTNDPSARGSVSRRGAVNKHGPHWEAGAARKSGKRDPLNRSSIQNVDKLTKRKKTRVAY